MAMVGALLPAYPPAKVFCPRCYERTDYNKCRVISRVHSGVVLKDSSKLPTNEPLTSSEYVRELASRECPRCKYLLPYNIESVRTFNVVIIGDVGSGKSHYIAALLRHIQAGEVQSEKQYLAFTCLTPDVLDLYKREYIRPLFDDKEALPPTRPLTKLSSPLIYEINIMQSSNLPFKRVNLVVYERGAEDVDIKEFSLVRNSMLYADAILYFVDPIRLPKYDLPSHLRPGLEIPMRADPAFILNSISSLIEQSSGRKVGTLCPIPCAIVLSKSNLWLDKVSDTSPYYRQNSSLAEYRRGVNLKDLNLRDQYLRTYISGNYRDLLAMTISFEQTCFFAVSATGHSPDVADEYPAIEPQGCPDPLLWILDKLGVIKLG